jgi:hypothetical protein
MSPGLVTDALSGEPMQDIVVAQHLGWTRIAVVCRVQDPHALLSVSEGANLAEVAILLLASEKAAAAKPVSERVERRDALAL